MEIFTSTETLVNGILILDEIYTQEVASTVLCTNGTIYSNLVVNHDLVHNIYYFYSIKKLRDGA